MSDSVAHTAAYLLHYRDYGTNDYIVDFFTLEFGLVTTLARGARGSKSRTRTLYQPFRPLLVSWFGERELRILNGIEDSGRAIALADQALSCGYYLSELVMRLLAKEQGMPELFAHYAMALTRLEANPETPELVLREFELLLLDALGLLPDFAHCTTDGTNVSEDKRYVFFPGHSMATAIDTPETQLAIPKKVEPPVMYYGDGETRDEGVKLSGSTLLALEAHDINSEAVLREIKPLMKRLLRIHLGDRPLRSRELFAAFTPPPPPPSATS